jgi:hypothetical protein
MARPYHPQPPYRAPTTGTLEQQLADMAAAISRKADGGHATTAVPFIGMVAPDGSTWKLSVDVTGAVVTEQVPRT